MVLLFFGKEHKQIKAKIAKVVVVGSGTAFKGVLKGSIRLLAIAAPLFLGRFLLNVEVKSYALPL